ncbi:putative MAP kinase kinase [Clavispora lusitaniae]|uniref:MAP kinase kinase n=1 Tax=Clavispora lusitaniae TaxID=36911 RepID=A0ACD0WMC1_CLALS|nr:putative MAP kinase kinase [Clavispora lusitaniae]QFZ34154.1 putative MAP kinase kinase [Clavispora lusitaniae]QFZ39838.1 putative MAP kinase kinase [Clavispora lusitaniae]QFZ45520.1 putative MAP kinase kinase [Clavispora lusitaniae]QFZ51184.1 putative MAP kinase kinase [Clavispora lusitaniae]
MGEERDVSDTTSRFDRLGISSPRSGSLEGTHSPPISTAHGQLSSDIQARIMAFQQKRQNIPLKEPPSKPLPPLPNAPIRSSSAVESVKQPLLASPSMEASTPTSQGSPQNVTPTSTQQSGLSKKPSLSQRRGMKLNMNDLSGQNSDSAPSTGVELARRLSERKRPDMKLDLNDQGSGISSAPVTAAEKAQGKSIDDEPKLQGLFANYSKYVDIKSGSLNFAGKASLHSEGVNFSSGSSFHISLDELQFIEELGRGNYGTVSKVLHKPTGVLMAMKEVRLELEENKFTQILMELEVLHKCNSPYIVDFYGAFFVEGAVYMCMEYMDGGSLDKVYGDGVHDEACLAYITECVIRGLKELKDKHNIIHRDVKPTNILVNTMGKVKLCDFGVSGNLVASLAKTNIGCQSYMAPERIKTLNPDDATYSVQSDIWSLGLTILEIAAGCYPYPPETYDNIFSQLSAIVDGEPPKLDDSIFSKEAQVFVKSCLNKNPALRPHYDVLLKSPWLTRYRDIDPHMGDFVKEGLKKSKEETGEARSTKPATGNVAVAGAAFSGRENVQSLLKNKVAAPALHRGGLHNQRLRR